MSLIAGVARCLLLYILYIPVTAWEGVKNWKVTGEEGRKRKRKQTTHLEQVTDGISGFYQKSGRYGAAVLKKKH